MAVNIFLLAVMQTLVVPALPLIGQQLHTTPSLVGWVATATMLAASALTPLFGRLGDVYGNRRIIFIALAVTLLGAILAATAHTISLLIAARVLQGASLGLFPLAISVLREELPRERLHHALSIAASAIGVGSGFAVVATGVLTQHNGDYRQIFWLGVALTVAAFALSAKALKPRPGRGGQVDYLGAIVLGLGLVALLLPISQGQDWGWGSGRVITLFTASVMLLVGFGVVQARTREPLVALSLLSHRPVLVANLASAFVGVAMFSLFLSATYFVQTPRAVAGFGFDASVLRTSLEFMLPGTLLGIPLGPIAGRLVTRIGPRQVLLAATVLGVGAMIEMAFLHANPAEFIVGLVLANSAVAVAYAAMPALLVMHVAPNETGVANSINSIMRTVGGSIGTAVVVSILSSSAVLHQTPTGAIAGPTETAYQTAFILSGVAFALAALLAAFGFRRGSDTSTTHTQKSRNE
jgi:MFS family permease